MCEGKSASFAEQVSNNTKCPTVSREFGSQGANAARRARCNRWDSRYDNLQPRTGQQQQQAPRGAVGGEEGRRQPPVLMAVTRREPMIPAGRAGSEVM
ncbi:hypothetical protein MTO96_018855 [Rhipicephalus appendiculatus]